MDPRDRIRIVIAHNAAFDRKIVERRLPCFARKPWACSHVEVPWHAGRGSGWELTELTAADRYSIRC